MKTSVMIGGAAFTDIGGMKDFIQHAERLGIDYAWSAEGWGQDAVTSLAYLAGQTSRISLGTGIMQISARTPSMTAMTALALHYLTAGRFILGLGTSGPQVVEGLHGTSFASPLARLQETVDICRIAFRGEKLRYEGRFHRLPLPGGEGKSLRIDYPKTHIPADIPIFLATLAPKALEYTGAAADGWLGTSFSPDHPEAHLSYIKRGAAAAGRSPRQVALHTACTISIGTNVEDLIRARKPDIAFSLGAMGSADSNFYNSAIRRAGFEDDVKAVQQLWLDGKRDQAAQRVPDSIVTQFAAIGTAEMVRERLLKYRSVGINGLILRVVATDVLDRMAKLEEVMDIINDIDAR